MTPTVADRTSIGRSRVRRRHPGRLRQTYGQRNGASTTTASDVSFWSVPIHQKATPTASARIWRRLRDPDCAARRDHAIKAAPRLIDPT